MMKNRSIGTLMRASGLAATASIPTASAMASTLALDELFRQNPINQVGGLSSQDARNVGGLGWFSEVVNDFDAGTDWTIDNVEFWGGYVTTTPGNTRGFTIRFYEDANGEVGKMVFEQDVMSFTEDLYYTSGSGFQGFHYSTDLSPAFVVPAPRTYWVSVVAILDRGGSANEPQWGWIDADGIIGLPSKQWFFSPGNFNVLTKDVSLVLNGSIGATCYADCDTSTGVGVLDIFDFLCFQDSFVNGETYACDCDTSTGNGVCDIFDFLCFQDAFVAGCP